jgi:ABC-type transporter lipoprotein component MlaA/pimeloyl-ACP methyl ester carboxylesterase
MKMQNLPGCHIRFSCIRIRAYFLGALAGAFIAATAAIAAEPAATNSPPNSARHLPVVKFAPLGESPSAPEDAIVLPAAIPDPIEPVNRRLWIFNREAMTAVVKPSSKVYRAIVVKPLRIGISNIGRNLAYPKRLVNNMLQGRWAGAGDETSRFLCNSVLGIGGIFDMATRWDIPASNADFGQTFATWGWHPNFYLMLPILGPSNDRDAVGAAADSAVNPLTYFSPYSYITYGITYNDLTDTVDNYVRMSKTDADPYYVLHYAASFRRETYPVDLQLRGPRDPGSLQTLGAAFFTFKDHEFPEKGDTRTVVIPATGRELPYRCWLQPKKAPIVYVIPGVASHRLNAGALALAEGLYQAGFSAVTVSSTLNYEFMERAATADFPGWAPVDAHDLHVALTRIDEDLQKKYPHRLDARVLMGYSMGGFHTLFIAADADNGEHLLKFDRYVAIDAPVRLMHAIETVDAFFKAPLKWPANERTAQVENTLLKVAVLAKQPPSAGTPLPFSGIESKFLVGLAFKLNLRDIIFTSELRHNHGILRAAVDPWHRRPVYNEILQYSYGDYLKEFVTPYYQKRGTDLSNREILEAGTSLRGRTRELQRNLEIRLIENRDDILLAPEDLEWLSSTFKPEQLTFFEHGGHLGNMSRPDVQKAILQTVEDLIPAL